MFKKTGCFSYTRMDEASTRLFRVNEELEEESYDGDNDGADDGEAVVNVVLGHLHGEVLDLAKPHENIKAETGEPEEDTEHGELEKQTKNDATACLEDEVPELEDDDVNYVGECQEEAERVLDGGAMVGP